MTSLHRFLIVAAVAIACFLPHLVAAEVGPVVPPLTGRVVDRAGILSSSEEQILTQKLADAERTSGAQIVIATLPGLSGYSIETWGLALGNGWKIGHAGKDDGVVIVVAPNEREIRIEVGYGLEGRITNREASSIIEHLIVPAFRGGNYALGLSDAIATLQDQIQNPNAGVAEPLQLGVIIAIIVIILLVGIVGVVMWIGFRGMAAPPVYGPIGAGDQQLTYGNMPNREATGRFDSPYPDRYNPLFGNSWTNDSGPSFGGSSSGSSHSSSFSGGGGSFHGGGASGSW